MAISTVKFLITNGWPAGKCAAFSILSTVFRHLWDGWDGWPIASFPTIQFPSSRPPFHPVEAQINRISLDAPLNYFNSFFLLGEPIPWPAYWLASAYHILPFFAGSHQHQMGGGPPSSLQGPLHLGWRGYQWGGHSQLGGWWPSMSEHGGGPLQLVTGLWRLWQVTPPHWGMVPTPHCISIVFLFISTFPLIFHYLANSYLRLIFLKISHH